MENLLRTSFERRILWKIENQRLYYNKHISWSPQLFQKTDIARENACLRTINRKLKLNFIVIFNSFTDISFVKYVTKIFCISYCLQEKIWGCFKVQLSVTLFVYTLSSKGANHLQVLYIKLWETSMETFLLKLRSSNVLQAFFFFWKFAEVLGQHLKSSLSKILSKHIIQPIGSRRCFVNCLP